MLVGELVPGSRAIRDLAHGAERCVRLDKGATRRRDLVCGGVASR